MNGRQRFQETMKYGNPDRVPYFEEGIRDDVLKVWRKQGLSSTNDLADLFHTDRQEEIGPDLEPRPSLRRWPTSKSELSEFQERLDPSDKSRLPADWFREVQAWQKRDYPLLLRVHRGIFETVGIMGWKRFSEIMVLMSDDPDFIREMMALQATFACRLIEQILVEVEVDAVIFSEPIGDNNRPLISPKMYEDLALNSYLPILDLVRRHNVETIIFRNYANARILLPSILKYGFNCLWACEVNVADMDYLDIRHEFGHDLRLIGGIDTDVLRQDKQAIRREIEEKVPPLLDQGGYIPVADGRIRPNVPFENYIYYRQLLKNITGR